MNSYTLKPDTFTLWRATLHVCSNTCPAPCLLEFSIDFIAWSSVANAACPGGQGTPCSGHGSCTSGTSSKGPHYCECNRGWAPPACQNCTEGYGKYIDEPTLFCVCVCMCV